MSDDYEAPGWEAGCNEIGGHRVWADSKGHWPSYLGGLVGKTFFHPGTGHLYRVLGIVFQAEDNRWEVSYRRVSHGGLCTGPLFTHRPEDFAREGRFLEVKK